MENKKKILTIILIICIFCILSITTLIYYKSSFTLKNSLSSLNTFNSTKLSNTIKEPFDFFTCTMNLNNIDKKFVNNYMMFDGKSITNGPCRYGTLKMNISTCPVNANGNISSSCIPSQSIISSLGNPIIFTYDINPSNITKFFFS